MRLGIDIGGTFTDFVLLDDASGRITTYKCLTTPRDPSEEETLKVSETFRVSSGLEKQKSTPPTDELQCQ